MEGGVYIVYTPGCAPQALVRGVQPLGMYTLYTLTFNLCYGFILHSHHTRNLIGKLQNHPAYHRAPYRTGVEISMATQ